MDKAYASHRSSMNPAKGRKTGKAKRNVPATVGNNPAEEQRKPPVPAHALSRLANQAAFEVSSQAPLDGVPPSVDAQRSASTQTTDHAVDPMRLIRSVSHEMRNPLNGILGMAHLLSESQLDASQRSYLDAINESGGLLLRLVNDLLDLSALRAGSIHLSPDMTDIEKLVNQCMELTAPKAHAKNLGLGAVIDARLVSCVAGGQQAKPILDGARLQQVLINLLSNAIKFTPTGGVQLHVTVDVAAQDSSPPAEIENNPTDYAALIFDVRDTGPGIEPADQSTIFEPFARTSGVAAIEGTGLGLPLARSMAEAMRGSLDLLSAKPGLGAHFRLRLPLEGGAAFNQVSPQPLHDQTVLIQWGNKAERNLERDALCQALKDLGATAIIADSDLPTLGWRSHEPLKIDHLLVDATNEAALSSARLISAGGAPRPILLVRPGERDKLADFKDAGFSGYLIRPIRQASLLAMLTHRFTAGKDRDFFADPFDPDTADPGQPKRSDASRRRPEESAQDLPVGRLEPSAPKPAGDAPLRILLADDNPINVLLAMTTLEAGGHKVEVAKDGAQAVTMATSAVATAREGTMGYDVILLDLSMPALNGFEAAKAIRKAGYSGRLIAYSGNCDRNITSKLQAVGFDDFAQKPLAPSALQRLVGDQASSLR
ncbi:MAG: ATP-binding protein [Pseudomonadota bacterium]